MLDETKLELLWYDDKKFIWRCQSEAFSPNPYNITMNREYHAFVDICLQNEQGSLIIINDIMKKEDYNEILDVDLKVSVRNMNVKPDWNFIHVRNPKHTSELVQKGKI